MKSVKIEGSVLDMVVDAMRKSDLLGSLKKDSLTKIASRAELNQYDSNDFVFRENDPSDSFFIIVKGEAAVLHKSQPSEEMIELGRVKPVSVIGEIGLLLDESRSATIRAVEKTMILKFDSKLFKYMFENIPAFGPAISKNLSKRVRQLSAQIPLPSYDKNAPPPSPAEIKMLPIDFIIRHRVLPLHVEGSVLSIGFVNDPIPSVLNSVRRTLSGMKLKMVHIDNEYFDEILKKQAGLEEWDKPLVAAKKTKKAVAKKSSPRLDQMLKRMVGEGASDLHLSAGHVPRWRIDGDIHVIEGTEELGPNEAMELLDPVMDDTSKSEFSEANECDLTYAIPGVARFRVNLFRDDRGTCAVFRFIPSEILTCEQLDLPKVLQKLCDQPKGLIVVTGPTGSGKSTTLAAMIDHINKTRNVHIITMEDPIEFIHTSDKALINQRQIRRHSKTYSSALKSALREDPDIILVGELRDLETISLAVETANTGHLVLGTLHTSTAISTMDRIINVFPADEQSQTRVGLAESLKGVVAQNLCKAIGGGRVAVFEILVVNRAVSNLIREAKPQLIMTTMQTGKAQGNSLLNNELATLIRKKKITREEALSKSSDKEELIKQLDTLVTPTIKRKVK